MKQFRLNKMLEEVLSKEDVELAGLRRISKVEEEEVKLLRDIRVSIDKMVYGDAYSRTLAALMDMKTRKVELIKEDAKLKKLANAFWAEIARLSKNEIKVKKEKVITKEIKEVEKGKEKVVKKNVPGKITILAGNWCRCTLGSWIPVSSVIWHSDR